MKGSDSNFLSNYASGNIISGGMNAPPNSRQAGLIGGVTVCGPLQDHVDTGTIFEYKKLILSRMEFSHAARKEGIPG